MTAGHGRPSLEEPPGRRHSVGLDARGNLQAPGQTSRAVSVPMRDNQSGLRLPHRWGLVIMLQSHSEQVTRGCRNC